MENRNICVDSMKGLAIIGVVLIHINSIEKAYPYLPIVNKFASIGAKGVQIFFMISAFLIFHSLHRLEMKKQNNGISNWYLQKLIRLIPVYYISNILWLILVARGGEFTI